MTLSASDAAHHAVLNPYLHPILGDHTLILTIGFLVVLALVFLKGFREAIGVATIIAVPYLILNAVVIGRCFAEIAQHPERVTDWRAALALRGDWTGLLVISAIVFPKLALGLSGFETGVAVMPQIAPSASDTATANPGDRGIGSGILGRIVATRKLLLSAALIMSTYLIGSSVVTTLLLQPADVADGGPAAGRALAHLAHTYLGSGFGTLYDASTIAILWFAGASAMAAMLNLIPRYLPRFGMAPRWVAYARPLVLVLMTIDIIVTLVFRADVERQGGAYATGVLVLILSASLAVFLALRHEAAREPDPKQRARMRMQVFGFGIVTAILAYTLIVNVIERPDGVVVSSCFIAVILVLGAASRYIRANELRVERVAFADEDSKALWPSVVGKKVHLVALRGDSAPARERKRAEILSHYRTAGPFGFVHVELLDNRSEFLAPLQLRLRRQGADYDIRISGAVAVANSIAYVSELVDPVSIYLGLTRQNLMTQSFRYLTLGEGEVGFTVYSILVRYWEWTPEDDVRPFIFLMSE